MDKQGYYDRFFSVKISQRPTISKRILFNEVQRKIKKQLVSNKADKLEMLDVGCGPGHLIRQFTGNPRLKLTGADITDSVLGNLKKRIPEADFISLDFSKPQDLEPHYDILTAVEIFEHIPREEKRTFLANCAACLRDNGILILTTPNNDRRHRIPAAFRNTQPVEDWVNSRELLALARDYFHPISMETCIWYFPKRWMDMLFKRLLYPFHMTLEQRLLRSTMLGGHLIFTAIPKRNVDG